MAKRRKKFKKKVKKFFNITLFILFIGLIGITAFYYLNSTKDLKPESKKKDYYTLEDFGYVFLKSEYDFNNNGIDDNTDILKGAKKYAKFNPKYKSEYYADGYPPVETEGVCTDLIWYALQNAGYNLKDMISKDIEDTKKENLYGIDVIDSNIDFRRVGNQERFFERYVESLDTDYTNMEDFMPGDILTFDDSAHIAMVSNKLNKNGIPYLIQNRDETQKEKEEDRLEKTDMQITGHYRFAYNKKLKELIDKL